MRAALPGVRGQRRHRALGHLAPHRYRRADRVAAHRLGLLAPAQPAGLPPHPSRRRAPVPVAETVLTSRRGTTSHHANPWVMVDAGDATEDGGEVWSAALAWSGSWRVTVARDALGHVGWTGGFGHDGISWRLRPSEEWRTPVLAGLYSPGGFGATSRQWHEYARRHVLPRPEEVRPIVYNSWEATGFDVNEDNQKRLAGMAAALGGEMFVVDDG